MAAPRCGMMGPNGEGPCVHKAGHVERGYAIHRDASGRTWVGKPRKRGWFEPTIAWIRAQIERSRRIDAILDRIRAQDEARRERARARREAKKKREGK